MAGDRISLSVRTVAAALSLTLCGFAHASEPAAVVAAQAAAPAQAQSTAAASSKPALPEMVPIPGQNFDVGRYEVTFAQWDACVDAGGCGGYRPGDNGWGRGDRPVINITWRHAQYYAEWLSKTTGRTYRLLTSAEWEIAARAGATTKFSWGDEDPVCEAKARNGANFADCNLNRTKPVGTFAPNPYGLYDMHGNVWEWVADCHDPACAYRLLRGGSWYDIADSLASAELIWSDGADRYFGFGFRVAMTRDAEAATDAACAPRASHGVGSNILHRLGMAGRKRREAAAPCTR